VALNPAPFDSSLPSGGHVVMSCMQNQFGLFAAHCMEWKT
jgi:hypothetical protein